MWETELLHCAETVHGGVQVSVADGAHPVPRDMRVRVCCVSHSTDCMLIIVRSAADFGVPTSEWDDLPEQLASDTLQHDTAMRVNFVWARKATEGAEV